MIEERHVHKRNKLDGERGQREKPPYANQRKKNQDDDNNFVVARELLTFGVVKHQLFVTPTTRALS